MEEQDKIILDDKTEVIDLSNDIEETLDDIEIPKVEPPKTKKKNFWQGLSKKKKIIIIAIILAVVVLTAIVLLLLSHKKSEPKSIVIEQDNYRYENGSLVFIDKDGKDLGSYDCQNKNEKYCYVAYYNNESELDLPKVIYEDDSVYLKRTSIYKDNFVFVVDSLKEGEVLLYNIKTKSIDGKYEFVKLYRDDYVITKDENGFGVIELTDDKANTILESKYQFLGYFNYDNSLIFQDKNGYGIMDVDGNLRANKVSGVIKAYNDKFIITEGYKLYNYSNKLSKLPNADYLELVDNYIILIKDKKLFVYDENFNSLNKDGISLTSDEYVKTTIVDKNGKVIEEKKAFAIEVIASNIKITVGEEETNINPIEAKLNNNYSYVSYSDGALHFYSDDNKEKEIGKYTCNNSNHVTEKDTEYIECFIAKGVKIANPVDTNDLGYIPIYNNRFVFIADQSSVSSSKNIVFYDLKTNKVLSNYLEVDVGYVNSTNNIVLANADNAVMIAHKPNSSYIAFLINSDGVNPIIRNEKNAKSIKYLNTYLLTQYSDGTYHLFNVSGDEITKNLSALKYEIVDYYNKYIVVNHDGKYQIYNVETGKMVSDEFSYVSLKDSYYVGINDKELNLYNYSSKSKVLCKDVSVDGAGEYKGAYVVKYNNPLDISITINTSPKKEYVFKGLDNYTVDGIEKSCGE